MAKKSDRQNPMFKGEDRATATEMRDRQLFNDIRKERNDIDAKTVRLKALRLEKEAADAAAAALKPATTQKRAVKEPTKDAE
jgi:hypothetical protein